ncbi:transporter substrate-binding domain-containing protein [bacterium]|nr:transporter substrate-binding domain-containing protein [bacterium]
MANDQGLVRKKIIVGGDFDYPPYTYLDIDGNPMGQDVEIILRIAEKMDFDVEFKFTPWQVALKNLEIGKVDMLLSILATDPRSHIFDFSIPYSTDYYTIFVRPDSEIQGVADLQNKELIALQSDAAIEEFIKPLGLLEKINYAISLPEAIKILHSGRHDFVIAPYAIGMNTINKISEENRESDTRMLKAVGQPIMPILYRLSVRKGDVDLLTVLNDGIDQLKSNGELEKIHNRWLSERLNDKQLEKRIRYAKYILVTLLVVVLILLLWSWTLRREVGRKSAKLRKSMQEAELANLAKSRFLANMSHEIRTPLNAILGFAQILVNDSKDQKLPANFSHFLQNIKSSGEQLSELISNILDISKIEAGKSEIALEEVNLRQLVKDIYEINKIESLKKGLIFNYSYDSDLSDFIQSDHNRLNQVMLNLVRNAIKFTPEGKSVWFKLKKQGGELLIDVEDEGIGIPAKHREIIFYPFEQLGNSVTGLHEGTGLGLAIVRENVRLMGGRISLQSSESDGTCFVVYLPLIESKQTDPGEPVAAWNTQEFSSNNTVLIIEDNKMTRDYLSVLFDKFGVKMELATTGKEGIEKALSLKPDLILMDVRLPDISGLEITKRILEDPKGSTIPIVVLSADVLSSQKQAAFEAGAKDYLTKPLQFSKLTEILTRYLAKN